MNFLIYAFLIANFLCISNEFLGCDICNSSISTMKDFLFSNSLIFFGKQLIKLYCKQNDFQDYVCDEFEIVVIESYKLIINRFLSNTTCIELNLCKYPLFVRDEQIIFKKQALKYVPPTLNKREFRGKKLFNVGVITDIHLDLNYTEGRSIHCNHKICCENDSGTPKNKDDSSGMFGQLSKCSVSNYTVDSAIKQLRKENLDMLLWLGDNMAQSEYTLDKSYIINSTVYINNKLIDQFSSSKTKIFPIMGNHEATSCDAFDPFTHRETLFLQEFADIFKFWLDDAAVEELKIHPFYSQKFNDIKVIAYGPYFYDSHNLFIFANSTNIYNALSWINQSLYESEMSGEKVIIIGHIPSNSDFAMEEWTERFINLVERYQNIIITLQYGHNHHDYFYPIYSRYDNHPIIISQVNPSITSYSQHLPSYRVFYLDKRSYEIQNYVSKRLDINQSNKKRSPIWYLSFDFQKFFNVANASLETHIDLITAMQDNDQVYQKFISLYCPDINNSCPTLRTKEELIAFCLFINDISSTVSNCLEKNVSSRGNFYYKYVPYFEPKWGYIL